MTRFLLFVAAVVPAAFLATCAAPEFPDPIATMSDRKVQIDWRISAAEQAKVQGEAKGEDGRRIAALNKIVWESGHPFSLRRVAIDHLIEHDERVFRDNVAKRITLIREYKALKHILDIAVERNWTDFTAAAVRSYARPMHGTPDNKRPERDTIEKLHPGKSLESVVFNVLISDTDSTDAQRVAAWQLLCRLADTETLVNYLQTAPANSALIVDIKAAATDLHAMPINREGIAWLFHLRDPARQAYWNRAKAVVAGLNAEQKKGLELRHLPVLVDADAALLQQSREQLLAKLQALLAGAEHHLNSPNFMGGNKDHPQRLHSWKDQLSWADLVVIQTLSNAVRNPAVVRSLFSQGDRDVKNKGSEHGGVVVFNAGTPAAKNYDPILRLSHNRKFTPRNEMIKRLYTAAAHYHFHAQEYKNRDWAGPGLGDMNTADTMRFNYLVFTFVDENRLNVDYYQHGRVVVDLGTLRR